MITIVNEIMDSLYLLEGEIFEIKGNVYTVRDSCLYRYIGCRTVRVKVFNLKETEDLYYWDRELKKVVRLLYPF